MLYNSQYNRTTSVLCKNTRGTVNFVRTPEELLIFEKNCVDFCRIKSTVAGENNLRTKRKLISPFSEMLSGG
jgi:hypothetical protein